MMRALLPVAVLLISLVAPKSYAFSSTSSSVKSQLQPLSFTSQIAKNTFRSSAASNFKRNIPLENMILFSVKATDEATIIQKSKVEYDISRYVNEKENSTISTISQINDITNALIDESSKPINDSTLNNNFRDKVLMAIEAWSQTKSTGGVDVLEQLLNRLEKETDERIVNDFIMRKVYISTIEAYSRLDKTHKAETILERMECAGFKPNSNVYNKILDAYAKRANNSFCKKSEILLDKMEKIGSADRVSYNIVFNAHAKLKPSRGKSGIESDFWKSIESRLAIMEDSTISNVKPDVDTYNAAISTLVNNSGGRENAEMAERIMTRMFDHYQKGNVSVKPTTVTMNIVLNVWATSREDDAAQKTEKIIENMKALLIEPDTISYTTLIDAYAQTKSEDGASNADRVFRKMEKQFLEGNLNMKPNIRSRNTVLNAWAKSGSHNGIINAENILRTMVELYKNGHDHAKPNVVSFTTVISGWAKCKEPESAHRAQGVFDLMEQEYTNGNIDAKPNRVSYSSLIDAWVKSREAGSAQRAEDVYNKWETKFIEGVSDVRLTSSQVTQIMVAYKSSSRNSGEKVESLLKRLQNFYSMYKTPEMRPHSITYTTVIDAWAKSKCFRKAKKARDVLDDMIIEYENGNKQAMPSVFSYTAVLNACAFTVKDYDENEEALKIALDTYKDLVLSKYAEPNHITYITFLRVCINLIPKGPSLESALEAVVRKCCSHGQVSEAFLRLLENSLARERLEVLFQRNNAINGPINIKDIPSKWTCNVKESDGKFTSK